MTERGKSSSVEGLEGGAGEREAEQGEGILSSSDSAAPGGSLGSAGGVGVPTTSVEPNETRSNALEVLLFTSPTCAPCKRVERMLHQINVSMFGNRLKVVVVDVSADPASAQRHRVFSVPTLVIGNRKMSVAIEKQDVIDAILHAFIKSVELPPEGGRKE